MKSIFGISLRNRSVLIAAASLPFLYAARGQAQTPPPPAVAPPPMAAPAPPVAAAPATPAPPAPPVVATTPADAPAVVTPPAAQVGPAPETPPPPPQAPPPPPAEEEKYKHINMGIWMRIDATLADQRPTSTKLNHLGSTGELELHFSNQMRKYLQWTANLVGTYDAQTIDGSGQAGKGTVGILDLIAQFEPDPAFNLWVGRMLVPSDRSNFSGPYFMGPWHYPGLGGPKEGPFGRNDGVTIWGQFEGGLAKYYLGAFNLHDPAQSKLISGRVNISLLNPEPGYYNSSTYYGKDILAIGVGGQYQKNGTAGTAPGGAPSVSDYGLFNADLLFEKDLMGSGVLDLEGAFDKYLGSAQTEDFSYFALASYLTPQLGDIGKLQPLLRVQQRKPKGGGDSATIVDAQVGYVVDSYSTRFAVGYTHTSVATGDPQGNAVFAGVQLQK